MKPVVSIILVNYNTSELTCNCIRSIKKNVVTPYEIIVVDNNSIDNSLVEIKALSDGTIKFIEASANLGFGRANNLGAKSACGKYIFLLNTDTILNNDPFPYFIQQMERDRTIGVVGGILKDAKGNYSQSGGAEYSISRSLKLAIFSYLPPKYQKSEINQKKPYQEVGFITGADMFMETNLFQSLDGFDNNIFMYYEDVDLCHRIRQKGYKCVIIQGPNIIHLEGKSSGKENGETSSFSMVHNTASMIYCMHKKYSATTIFFFQITLFLIKLPKIISNKRHFGYWPSLEAIWSYKKYTNNIH